MQRLAVLVASAIGIASTLHAQEFRTPRGSGPIAESASRIARDWWPTEPRFFTIDEEGRPRFRAVTSETLPAPPWQLSPEIPLTPARGAISHQEMLRVMTPKEFSSPVIGASVDPGSLYNDMKKAWREWQAQRIHEQVVKELEEFKRMRAAAAQDH